MKFANETPLLNEFEKHKNKQKTNKMEYIYMTSNYRLDLCQLSTPYRILYTTETWQRSS